MQQPGKFEVINALYDNRKNWDLTNGEFSLLMYYYIRRANTNGCDVWEADGNAAEALGTSRQAICKRRKSLHAKGWLTKYGTGEKGNWKFNINLRQVHQTITAGASKDTTIGASKDTTNRPPSLNSPLNRTFTTPNEEDVYGIGHERDKEMASAWYDN